MGDEEGGTGGGIPRPHRESAAPVSPLVTGGAGTVFEYRLGAVVLGALLRGDHVQGLDAPAGLVALQQRMAGSHLDDIVAYQSDDAVGRRTEIQVKLTVSPVRSDRAFQSVLTQCLDTLRDHALDVEEGTLTMVLAASGPHAPLTKLRFICRLARVHAAPAKFLEQAQEGVLGNEYRTRLDHVRGFITDYLTATHGTAPTEDEVNETAHRLLRHLRIWIIDADADSAEIRHTLDRLSDLLPSGTDQTAHVLFSELCDVAEEAGQRAGSYTATTLRTALARRGAALASDPRYAADLAALARHTDRVLVESTRTLGNKLSIDRRSAIDDLATRIANAQAVVVTGAAGVGKSVVARQLIEQLAENGAMTAAINLAGRTRQTFHDLSADIGANLTIAFGAAATTGTRVLLVDSAEQVLEDGGSLLRRVLVELPRAIDASLAWHVVVVSRTDAGPTVKALVRSTLADSDEATLDDGAGGLLDEAIVAELDDNEVGIVVSTFPSLEVLRRHPRGMRILRRPYLVDVLLRANAALPTSGLLAEEGVVDLYWDHVVRQGEVVIAGRGAPDARADICTRVAEHHLTDGGAAPVSSPDPSALSGLRSDEILIRERDRHRFAHDVLTDYSCAYLLAADHHHELYITITQPRRALRAVRLAFQHRLTAAMAGSSEDIRTAWQEIRSDAESLNLRDGPRWVDVPYESILNGADPGKILAAITDDLVAGTAGSIFELLAVTRRHAATPRASSTRNWPLPAAEVDLTLTRPIVELVIHLASDLPHNASLAAPSLIRDFLATAAHGGQQSAVTIDTVHCAQALVGWVGDDRWGPTLETALSAFGLLGGSLPIEARDLIDRVGWDRPDDLDVLVEDTSIAAIAAASDPDLLLRCAGFYYLDEALTLDPDEQPTRPPAPEAKQTHDNPDLPSSLFVEYGVSDEFEEGVRDHSHNFHHADMFVHAHPRLGPFRSLLNAAPAHGLNLIAALVARATQHRVLEEESWGHHVYGIKLVESVRPLGMFVGTADVYQWHRRTSTGPHPVMSALMALREWALEQVTAGQSVRDVRDQLLGLGDSLAYIAVAYSVAVANLGDVTDELDPFLSQPDLWHLEVSRVVGESSGLALRLPEDQRVTWQPQDVAVAVVLSQPERADEFRNLGNTLINTARATAEANGLKGNEIDQSDDVLVARRWAALLDREHYTATPSTEQAGMIEISVSPPAEVTEALSTRGGAWSVASLQLASLQHRAIQTRDREQPSGDADTLWDDVHRAVDTLTDLGGDTADSPTRTDEVIAATAAAIIVAASDTGIPGTHVFEAAALLCDSALRAPSALGPTGWRRDRDTAWTFGTDRSAARSLPLLLSQSALRKAVGVDLEIVGAALIALGGSLHAETRQHLASGIAPALDVDCSSHQTEHEIATAVLFELVATGGLGNQSDGYGLPAVRVPDPITDTLVSQEHLDVVAIGDALPTIFHAARGTCGHARQLASLAQAIVTKDLVLWLEVYARNHYMVGWWRRAIDSAVADRALTGDPTWLYQYQNAWARYADQLVGLLTALTDQADTPEKVAVIFEIWPNLIDELSPSQRSFEPLRDRDRPERVDVDHLDRALLPLAAKDRAFPNGAMSGIAGRWAASFVDGRPQVADRLLDVIIRQGWLRDPHANSLLLSVAGDDVEDIGRDFRMATVWLRFVLILHRAALKESDRARALSIVDRLAVTGDADALQLQRDLEA